MCCERWTNQRRKTPFRLQLKFATTGTFLKGYIDRGSASESSSNYFRNLEDGFSYLQSNSHFRNRAEGDAKKER
jgi:hypothetical protein